ncbi:MAG: hypothetical protein K6T85_11810 [Gorillibacterium sp.]|nr:hypothetical protein [Gorillibacterium sp.]
MLIYAVPQLRIGEGWTLPTIFGILWLSFALIIIAAHLHDIIGVGEETRAELKKISRMKRWQLEQRLSGRSGIIQATSKLVRRG